MASCAAYGRTARPPSTIQAASEPGNAAALVFFLFDLLFLDGEDLTRAPLADRKARLAALLSGTGGELQYSDHQAGRGPAFYKLACDNGLEGIVSKRADAAVCAGRPRPVAQDEMPQHRRINRGGLE
jgi:bifunctional non-homologous end joining protein LigD